MPGLPKLFTDFIGLLKLVKLYSKQDGNQSRMALYSKQDGTINIGWLAYLINITLHGSVPQRISSLFTKRIIKAYNLSLRGQNRLIKFTIMRDRNNDEGTSL